MENLGDILKSLGVPATVIAGLTLAVVIVKGLQPLVGWLFGILATARQNVTAAAELRTSEAEALAQRQSAFERLLMERVRTVESRQDDCERRNDECERRNVECEKRYDVAIAKTTRLESEVATLRTVVEARR